ncbi:MAG: type II toxin-antitoxin system Phd/YefM family antitoxin [Gemmatimonadota bacterium]
MQSFSATEARKALNRLLVEVTVSSEPVQITSRRARAILVSRDDWDDLQETIYLLSKPGLRASIREALHTRIEDCGDELGW